MKRLLMIFAAGIALMISSCSKDVDEDLNPIDTCVSEDMSFQSDILSIFDFNCNGCHGTGLSFGGITLDNHAGVKAVVDAGRLIGAIAHDDGFSAMPQGGAKLSDCNISKVTAWVEDGALDN